MRFFLDNYHMVKIFLFFLSITVSIIKKEATLQKSSWRDLQGKESHIPQSSVLHGEQYIEIIFITDIGTVITM